MKLRDLFKLEIGDQLSLKGTNLVFEIRGFDSSDPERPVMVSLVSGDTPAIANIMYDDPTVVEPGELFWVFANKKAIQEDTDLTKSEFENEYGDCNFLTVRNLEVYKDPLEFSEGDIVEFKDGNCKFEVIGIDRNSRRLTYNLRVIATDKPITYGPADVHRSTGEFWVLNTRELAESSYRGCMESKRFYCVTADRLVKAQGLQGLQASQASQESQSLENKIHEMFELPTPEELRRLAIQFHLDDVVQIIKDAARRGGTSVNLPMEQVEEVKDVLISAGYKVEPFNPTNRCVIGW